jgi:hypothetical protein
LNTRARKQKNPAATRGFLCSPDILDVLELRLVRGLKIDQSLDFLDIYLAHTGFHAQILTQSIRLQVSQP